MPGSPCLRCCIQNWTGMRWQTRGSCLLDEEGAIGGEYRHIAGAAASFHSGGGNGTGSAGLHLIELLRKYCSIGQKGKKARGASDSTKGWGAGDAAESACGGPCPGQSGTEVAAATKSQEDSSGEWGFYSQATAGGEGIVIPACA